MKQLIVPIAIIVALIAFFVIIDRKEFSRQDDVQTVQSESPTTSRKPTVSVPETKPVTDVKPAVETKLVVETKSVTDPKHVTESEPKTDAEKPVAETKPVETKPIAETNNLIEAKPVTETKPAETNSVAETKPTAETKSEAKPTAVPVVTAKEAKIVNDDSLIDLENTLKATKTKESDMNVLEGKIKIISNCPAPQEIDYPDCNLTVSVVLNDDEHTEIILIVPCIRGSKRILSPSIKDGAIIRFRIIDDSDVSDDEKSIQIADDISNIDLECFYIDFVVSIETFSGRTKYIKKEYNDKQFNTHLILTNKDIQARKDYIEKELKRLNSIIDSYSKEDANIFRENLLKISQGIGEDNFPYVEVKLKDTNIERTKYYALNANVKPIGYLESACSYNTERLFKNALAIASVKEWFQKKGIHLIVIPVPQHTEAFVDKLNLSNRLSTYNIDRILLMKYLLQMDVEIIDIEPYIEKNLSEDFYYHNSPESNIHFRPSGDYFFAQHIYDHLKQYEFLSQLIQNNFVGSEKWYKYSTSYCDNSFSDMKDVTIQADLNPVTEDSPILLIGDSFTATNLRKTMAYFFASQISAISQGGGAPSMAKILQTREKSISEKTRIAFFVFYTSFLNRDFTPIANTNPELFKRKTAETTSYDSHNRFTQASRKENQDISPAPSAVPVATPEEAEKLNMEAKEFALAEKERREPFYKLYQDTQLDSVCFQGTIRATSTIPDPEKNDYDNCLYALFVEIDSLLSEVPADAKIASEVIINVPIMKDKTILQDNQLLPGDRVWCTCADYDAMPQSIQEIQLSDDIQSYEHQQYFPIRISKISSFQKGGNRNFTKREITILPIQMLPKDEKASVLRKERIKNEIARIEDEIKEHGGSFEKWKEEYKPIANNYKKLCQEEFKGWINNSYFSAKGNESTYNTRAYIDWITPYKKYLEMNNIDLIILRYPSRSDFAARVLAADEFQENPAWVEHYYECLKNDIEIIDPMQEMYNKRFDYPLFYYYDDPSDIHAFEGELIVSAEILSEVLNRYTPKRDKAFELKKRCISNNKKFCYPDGNPNFSSSDPIDFDGLTENDEIVGPLEVNTGSPFLFLSNSLFGYKVMQERGASIPHYTSFFLQSTVDWKYQSGVANPMIRNLISTATNLDKRKAVIMVGQYNLWTSGPKIPKYFFDDTSKILFESSYNFLSSDISINNLDSYVVVADDNGSLSVSMDKETKKTSATFTIELSAVPPNPQYTTCMIRINFDKITGLVNLIAKNNSERFDNTTLTLNSDLYADLFVPVSQSANTIEIVFSGSPSVSYVVNSLELWYY